MAGRAVRAGGGITIDARQVRGLARAVRLVAPKLYTAMRGSLRSAGDIVADDARDRAASWSSRIPATVKVRTSATTVAVEAGGTEAPHAAAYELGSPSRRGTQDSFRHPVFGRLDRWVDQDARPFLEPAAKAHIEEVAALVAEAVNAALDRL